MGEKLSRDIIIKAVLDTAFARSTGATSLADIANTLHIKKASLYNHFNNRQDLIDQTILSCKEYISEISFIPDNIDAVAKKYTAEAVLKGLVDRYFKMHEKTPLFQIYTFLESEKYFSFEAANIVIEQKKRLVAQTEKVLTALADQVKVKLTHETIPSAAMWFCSGLNDLLNFYLLNRKQLVMENPQSGEGELFTLPQNDKLIEEINTFVDKFVVLIR